MCIRDRQVGVENFINETKTFKESMASIGEAVKNVMVEALVDTQNVTR